MNQSELNHFKQALHFLHQDSSHMLEEELVEHYVRQGLLEERDGKLQVTELAHAKLANAKRPAQEPANDSIVSLWDEDSVRVFHHRGFDIRIQLNELKGGYEAEFQIVDTDDLRKAPLQRVVHAVRGLHPMDTAVARAYVDAADLIDEYLGQAVAA